MRLASSHRPTEHELQSAVFDHKDYAINSDPRWFYVVGIPNGAKVPYRRLTTSTGKSITIAPERQKLLDEGLAPGFPDMAILYPAGGFHGAFLELKIPGNRATTDQIEWQKMLLEAGYKADILTTVDPLVVIKWIEDYFTLSESSFSLSE